MAAGGARRKFGKTYSRTYTNREREDVTKEKEDSLFPSMFSQELCQDETPTKAVPRQRRGESSRREAPASELMEETVPPGEEGTCKTSG